MKSLSRRVHIPFQRTILSAAILGILGTNGLALAEDETPGATVVVEGSRTSQMGIAESANSGVVTKKQLEARTVYRPGELLEATPGLIVSQHSGEGKANQYYLRGFNLDHGTDLRTEVDGMIVNKRSHSHGQGWTDLNFMIPELVTRLDYRKGPYYAEIGDFGSAGSVNVRYADVLPTGVANVGIGGNGYRRALVANSSAVASGHLLYALELFHNDGPFEVGDGYRKINGVLRYSQGDAKEGFNVTAMGYHGSWHATDQIPRRGVADERVPYFGAVDQTDGGDAHRYSLSGEWHRSSDSEMTKVNAYVTNDQLNLFSNFTYFLDDPINGDQFNQPDHRITTGLNAAQTWRSKLMGHESDSTVGLQLQNDNISNGLYSTLARERLSTTREDRIVESSIGLYLDNTTRWTDKFRTTVGLRQDHTRFEVRSAKSAANSGQASGNMTSPKLSLVFGPWDKTEYYFNIGQGFHSNDARGTTIAVSPKSGDPAEKVPGLVKSKGLEVGLRSEIIPGLQSTFSVYRLDFDSELIFQGDAGDTAAGRPSRRTGFEFSNYYKPTRWLTIDADIAFARARFRDFDPVGDRIPGSVEGVASLALAVDDLGPYFGALQLRYFGPRPLIEDNTARSKSTATLNGRIGYKISPKMKIELEGYNLTNRRDAAIDYYYESRLQGEATSVTESHFHPIESRSFRVSLNTTF